jgi:hypothetical protein
MKRLAFVLMIPFLLTAFQGCSLFGPSKSDVQDALDAMGSVNKGVSYPGVDTEDSMTVGFIFKDVKNDGYGIDGKFEIETDISNQELTDLLLSDGGQVKGTWTGDLALSGGAVTTLEFDMKYAVDADDYCFEHGMELSDWEITGSFKANGYPFKAEDFDWSLLE